MNYKNYIKKNRITLLKSDKKNDAIKEMVGMIDFNDENVEKQDILDKLFYRENIMSTGIGIEIGVPHIRYKMIKKPIIAIGVKPDGIKDYETIDKTIVKIIVMIILGENQHREHIRLLSQIVGILKDDSLRLKIINSNDIGKIYNYLNKN